MHDRVLAVENPVIRASNPDAGFVAGHDLGRANDGLRLFGLFCEPGMRADEHVHLEDDCIAIVRSAPSLTPSPKASRNRPLKRSWDSA